MKRKTAKVIKRAKQEVEKARQAAALLKVEKEAAEEKAEYYKKRFREFGSNVETVKTDGIMCNEWTVEVKPYGAYVAMAPETTGADDVYALSMLAEKITNGLLENNIIQIIRHDETPFSPRTVGAKLFVVPWDQMPHTRTIKISQMLEKILAYNDEKAHSGLIEEE